MKRYLIIILTALTFGCQEKIHEKPANLDVENIVILNLSDSFDLKEKGFQETHLTNAEISKTEHLLKTSIADHNSEEIKNIPKYQSTYNDQTIGVENVTINLNNYRRQYVPYIDERGEKVVYVYCMHNRYAHKSWRTEILYAAGGGDQFFEVLINLTTNNYSDFRINGPA